MSQHDMVIDNGPGAAVRADINAAIAALVSQSAGPVEPTTPYANMIWFDTGVVPNVARQRNPDNTGWVVPSGQIPGGDAPNDGALYGRQAAGWEKGVKLSGDRMTGALVLGSELAAPIEPGMVKASAFASQVGYGGNAAIGAGGSGYQRLIAGFAGFLEYNPANGIWSLKTAGNAAVGAPVVFTDALTISQLGALTTPQSVFCNGMYPTYPSNPGLAMFASGATAYVQMSAGNAWQFDATSGGTFTIQGYNGYRAFFRNSDGAFFISHQGYKTGGGSWADSSDARIKDVLGDYESGLADILALRPVRYVFKGNDTFLPPTNDPSPMGDGEPVVPPPTGLTDEDGEPIPPFEMVARVADEGPPVVPYPNSAHYSAAVAATEFVGFVAQEAEVSNPDLVTQREGYIDGEPVTDIRDIDQSRLIFKLINAVKTLNARIEALEAA